MNEQNTIRTRGQASEHYDKELRKLDSSLRKKEITYDMYVSKFQGLNVWFKNMVEQIKNERD